MSVASEDADVVIGITASGRTPFVLGALTRAKSLGAKTILLTCNPADAGIANSGLPQSTTAATTTHPDLRIDLSVGPEILTGSTRLKAGTATKVALNLISTGAMVALGKVRGNLMSISMLQARNCAIGPFGSLPTCCNASISPPASN